MWRFALLGVGAGCFLRQICVTLYFEKCVQRNCTLQAFEDGPDRGFRNVGQYTPDAGGNTQKLTQLILNTAKV
jgi:hypothetical protein